MPRRLTPLVTGEIYHIFNRSVAQQPIFKKSRECIRALEIIDYYRFVNTPLRFSHYNRLSSQEKGDLLKNLYKTNDKFIDIYAFSLMPNHYHLLVKQLKDGGVSKFLRIMQDSYAKYLNTKSKRSGSVFQQMFKAVRIETDEQFLHVSRYIHLNPLTSYVISQKDELERYSWNSYMDYLSSFPRPFINTDFLNKFFKSKLNFKKFNLNQLDFQRNLEKIKHLTHD